MLRRWMSCAKRGWLDEDGEVLIRGMVYTKAYTARGEIRDSVFRLTTRAITAYLLPSLVLLLMGSLFAVGVMSQGPGGMSGVGPLDFLLKYGLVVSLLLACFAFFAFRYDTLVIDTGTLAGHVETRWLWKITRHEFDAQQVSIIPTELYRTKIGEFRGNTRSKKYKQCELLAVELDEDDSYFLLWCSADGEEPQVAWLDALRGAVAERTAEDAGIDGARVVAEFGSGAY